MHLYSGYLHKAYMQSLIVIVAQIWLENYIIIWYSTYKRAKQNLYYLHIFLLKYEENNKEDTENEKMDRNGDKFYKEILLIQHIKIKPVSGK